MTYPLKKSEISYHIMDPDPPDSPNAAAHATDESHETTPSTSPKKSRSSRRSKQKRRHKRCEAAEEGQACEGSEAAKPPPTGQACEGSKAAEPQTEKEVSVKVRNRVMLMVFLRHSVGYVEAGSPSFPDPETCPRRRWNDRVD